jgi:hypothetical protein
MEFFESVKSSGSRTITSTIITPNITNNSKKVVISTLYLPLTFDFHNTKMLNVIRLYLLDKMKLKGKENY